MVFFIFQQLVISKTKTFKNISLRKLLKNMKKYVRRKIFNLVLYLFCKERKLNQQSKNPSNISPKKEK